MSVCKLVHILGMFAAFALLTVTVYVQIGVARSRRPAPYA